MKKIWIVLAIVPFLVGCVTSKDMQTAREDRAQAREDYKVKVSQSITDSTFVLATHTVFDRYGNSYIMDPSINFVMVNGNEITIQLSFNQLVGWNGIGGITLDGDVLKYTLNDSGKHNDGKQLKIRALGAAMGNLDLSLTISPSGNATAVIRGNWGNRITFMGDLEPLSESSFYKGQSI